MHSSTVSLCTSRRQNASPIGWHFYFLFYLRQCRTAASPYPACARLIPAPARRPGPAAPRYAPAASRTESR
ncbi:hypothetical protein E2R62_00880 [Citrobacter rodentium]|uniref:Uncharacterized protein n=1 Tax=Citrobacter rodentium TaxID=67825 RepID=A0A482PBH0_CITRO|nr:hypothetical protein E2R62_00880 [Citrobacter rodentium]